MESTIYKSIRNNFVLLLVVNFLLHTKLANVANVIKKQTNILMDLESRRAHREGGFKCVGETQLTMTPFTMKLNRFCRYCLKGLV